MSFDKTQIKDPDGAFLSHGNIRKSSMFIGVSILNHPFWGTPMTTSDGSFLERLLVPVMVHTRKQPSIGFGVQSFCKS